MNWARFLSATCAALALMQAPSAGAAIATDQSPELFLVMWDPVARVSYTKDLGLNLYAGTDSALREASFYVYAQQDAGFQQFWNLSTTGDAAYAQFRSLVADTSNVVWSVLAFDATQDVNPSQSAPGELQSFMTLRATSTPGVVGDAYGKLSALLNGDFVNQVPNMFGDLVSYLNQGTAGTPGSLNPFNSHAPANSYASNGSSTDVEGQLGYFGKSGAFLPSFGLSCQCDLTTPIGRSSWFYRVTTSDEFDLFGPVAIDEFDNLSNDGYWGLAVNPANGQLVLSYTLAPATLQSLAATAAGRQRASLTEYLAGSMSRVIDTPAGEFAGYVMPVVTPVPEPGALLLLAAGGLVLAASHRGTRRR